MITTAPERSAVAAAIPALHCSPNVLYSGLTSKRLSADLRIGWASIDWSDALQVVEVWHGELDLSVDLAQGARDAIEIEAHAERTAARWNWS